MKPKDYAGPAGPIHPVAVTEDDEVWDLAQGLQKRLEIFNDTAMQHYGPLFSRIADNVLRVATGLAVGDVRNREDRAHITIDHAQAAHDIVLLSAYNVMAMRTRFGCNSKYAETRARVLQAIESHPDLTLRELVNYYTIVERLPPKEREEVFRDLLSLGMIRAIPAGKTKRYRASVASDA